MGAIRVGEGVGGRSPSLRSGWGGVGPTGIRRILQGCWGALLVLALSITNALPAAAHGFQTAYLEINETSDKTVEVMWKTPPILSFGDEGLSRPITIQPVFPEWCQSVKLPSVFTTAKTRQTRWTLDCGSDGLAGQTIIFPGLTDSFVEVLLRLQWADGRSQTTMLQSGESSFMIPAQPTAIGVAATYLQLGISHIFSGIDHLLFVLGLVLIVGSSWRLVKTITAFTVAHSMTLGAATLGFVQVPQAPVEAVIALSILFLASELAHSRLGKTGLTERYPWLVALTFGLLHGFGFAGALTEVGLPANAIPPALLFFNVGVELGQLAFVLAVLTVMASIQRLGLGKRSPWLGRLPTYGIGGMASFWCIQRIAAFWEIG